MGSGDRYRTGSPPHNTKQGKGLDMIETRIETRDFATPDTDRVVVLARENFESYAAARSWAVERCSLFQHGYVRAVLVVPYEDWGSVVPQYQYELVNSFREMWRGCDMSLELLGKEIPNE